MKRFRQSFSQRQSGTLPEINLSPLIDMVFILLIFFIVTAVFVKQTGVKVNKPQAATASELNQQSILIGMDASGSLFYQGRPIRLQEVRSIVATELASEELPVIIQVDGSVSTQKTLEVYDQARLAGAESINVATRRKS